MTILYVLIARGTTVLAEFACSSGNFPTITRVLLGKISGAEEKMSYQYDEYAFHYITENKITFLCMSDDVNKRRLPFSFLEDLKETFFSTFGNVAQTAIAYSLSEKFGKIMQKKMDHYNDSSTDALSSVTSRLDDVKNVMIQNIDSVLARGEKLELLVEKTDQLQSEAFKFEKSSRSLKVSMQWRRLKIYALAFVVVALVLWLITSLACGFDYSKCK